MIGKSLKVFLQSRSALAFKPGAMHSVRVDMPTYNDVRWDIRRQSFLTCVALAPVLESRVDLDGL
jgi:hypothetical protein